MDRTLWSKVHLRELVKTTGTYPIENPATIRPTNIVAKLFAPACIAHPHSAMAAPSYWDAQQFSVISRCSWNGLYLYCAFPPEPVICPRIHVVKTPDQKQAVVCLSPSCYCCAKEAAT